MQVSYRSNNSGGDWWLDDDQWRALERAGWVVGWLSEPWLGARATDATRSGLSLEAAIREWAAVTGQNPYDEGCPCCGEPHNFLEIDDDGNEIS